MHSSIKNPYQFSNAKIALRPDRTKASVKPQKLVRAGRLRKVAESTVPVSSSGTGITVSNEENFTTEMLTLMSRDLLMPLQRMRENDLLWMMYLESPVIRSGVSLNTAIASSNFEFSVPDEPMIAQEYNEIKEELGLEQLMRENFQDFFIFGEAFNVKFFDDELKSWARIEQRAPQAFTVETLPVTEREEEKLFPVTERKYTYYDDIEKNWEKKHNPRAGRDTRLEHVGHIGMTQSRSQHQILDEFNVFHIYRQPASGIFRGVSPLRTALFYWILERALWTAQFRVINDRLMWPAHWKIGIKNPAEGYYPYPPNERFAELDSALQESQGAVTDYIITFDDVSLDVGSNSLRLLPIESMVETLQNIQAAAIWSEVGIQPGNRGFPSTFGQEWIWQQYRETRFKDLRDMVYRKKLINEIILPIAIARNYTKGRSVDGAHNIRTSKDRQPILPQVNCTNNESEIREIAEEHSYNLGELFGRAAEANRDKKYFLPLSLKTKHSSRKDYILPTINLKDHIKLQHDQQKVDTLLTLADKNMISKTAAAAYILESTGIDIDNLEQKVPQRIGSFLSDPAVLQALQAEGVPGEVLANIRDKQLADLNWVGPPAELNDEKISPESSENSSLGVSQMPSEPNTPPGLGTTPTVPETSINEAPDFLEGGRNEI